MQVGSARTVLGQGRDSDDEEKQTMEKELEILLAAAREHCPSAAELEAQRRSFAYGNTKIENARITREIIDREAEVLVSEKNGQ